MKRTAGWIAAFIVVLAAGFASAQERPEITAARFIGITEGFEIFHRALERAGLSELLAGDGPFTIFVPTNDAFEALPPADLAALLADPDTLRQLLSHHIVPAAVPLGSLTRQAVPAPTLAGGRLQLTADDGGVRVDGAPLVARDILVRNGTIHVLDEVLSPGRSSR